MDVGGQNQLDDQMNGQNDRDFDYNQLDEAVGKLMGVNKENQPSHREAPHEAEDGSAGHDIREDEPSMEEHHLPKPRGFALDVMHPRQRSMRTKDYDHQLDEPEITAGNEHLLPASDEVSARPAPYQDIMVARREASSTSQEVAEVDSQIKANSSSDTDYDSDDDSDVMQFEYSDHHDNHEAAPGERAIYSDDDDEDDDDYSDDSDDSDENYDAGFDDEVETDDESADEISDDVENKDKIERGIESRFESEPDEVQTESADEPWDPYQTEYTTDGWGYHDQTSLASDEGEEDDSSQASDQEPAEDQSARASAESARETLEIVSESVDFDQADGDPSLKVEPESGDQPAFTTEQTDSITELESDTHSTSPSYRRNYLSGALPANNLVKPKTEIDDKPSKGLFDTSEYHTAIKQPIKQPKNNCKKIVWSLVTLDIITMLAFAYYIAFH